MRTSASWSECGPDEASPQPQLPCHLSSDFQLPKTPGILCIFIPNPSVTASQLRAGDGLPQCCTAGKGPAGWTPPGLQCYPLRALCDSGLMPELEGQCACESMCFCVYLCVCVPMHVCAVCVLVRTSLVCLGVRLCICVYRSGPVALQTCSETWGSKEEAGQAGRVSRGNSGGLGELAPHQPCRHFN